MEGKVNCRLCWWIAAAGVLSMLGLVAFVVRAWDRVTSGHGLDSYFTGWGVQFSYVGFLVLIAVVPFALLLGYAVRYWELRHERHFKRRYGIRDDHT